MNTEDLARSQELVTKLVDSLNKQQEEITNLRELVEKHISYLQARIKELRDE